MAIDLSLRRLRIFVVVATERHFSRAAEQLHVSQPVVSQEIRRLERDVGARLFDRTSRRVELTAAGELLLNEAAGLLRVADALVEQVRERATGRSAAVRLAHTPSVADETLAVLLRDLEQELPAMKVEEREVDTGEVTSALRDGAADVGLARFPDVGDDLRAEVVRQERMVATFSRNHPLAQRQVISLHELADVPLLLWDRDRAPAYYDALVEACVAAGFHPLILIGPARAIGRSYLLEDGRAFALLPASTARRLPTGLRAVHLSEPTTLTLSVVWHRIEKRPGVLRFVDAVTRIGGARWPGQ